MKNESTALRVHITAPEFGLDVPPDVSRGVQLRIGLVWCQMLLRVKPCVPMD